MIQQMTDAVPVVVAAVRVLVFTAEGDMVDASRKRSNNKNLRILASICKDEILPVCSALYCMRFSHR